MTIPKLPERRYTLPEIGEAVYDQPRDMWVPVDNSKPRMANEYFYTCFREEYNKEMDNWAKTLREHRDLLG